MRISAVARSSACKVHGPAGMDSSALARAAAALGVLVESDSEGGRRDRIVMGVTSIPCERIGAGVEMLSRLVRRDPALGSRKLGEEATAPLRGRALHRALAGRTLLYNTVYGDPCTIEVRRDGALVDGDQVRWFNVDRLLIDTAVIVRA